MNDCNTCSNLLYFVKVKDLNACSQYFLPEKHRTYWVVFLILQISLTSEMTNLGLAQVELSSLNDELKICVETDRILWRTFFACRKILALYCKPERQRFRCNMKLNCKKFNILITCTTYPELWTKFRKGETSVEFLNSWDSFFCSFTKIFLPGMSPSISIFILVKVRVYYLKIW